jgi:hypothetical protein
MKIFDVKQVDNLIEKCRYGEKQEQNKDNHISTLPVDTIKESRCFFLLKNFFLRKRRCAVKEFTGDYSALINENIQPIITLNVQPREMQIQMIDLSQDIFNETETLGIDCQFPQTNINKDYKWYKYNQLLIPNGRIEIKKRYN